VTLASAPPNQPGVLILGLGATGLELGGLGAPNCFLNVASILVTLPFSTGSAGSFTFTTPLPDDPLVTGDVYWQFFYGWPARPHQAAIALTRGMRSHIE
jgi:hypothetical protein